MLSKIIVKMRLLQVFVNVLSVLQNLDSTLDYLEQVAVKLDPKDYLNLEAEDYIQNSWKFSYRNLSTYADALTLCKSFRQELFFYEPGIDLATLFTDLQISEIWTGLVKAKTSNSPMDRMGYGPYSIINDNETIESSRIYGPDPAGQTMHITLKKDTVTNTFSYEKVASNEQKNTLCKENLSFPFKETDQRAIRTFYFRIIKLLALEREHFARFKDMVSNIYNSWPKYEKDSKIYLQENDTDHSDSRDLAAEMNTEIESLNPIANIILAESKLIRSEADLLILETHMHEWQSRYKNLQKTLENLFFNPIKLVTENLLLNIQIDDANWSHRIVKIEEEEIRIGFMKDHYKPAENAITLENWQVLLTTSFWSEYLTKLNTRRFFTVTLWDIVSFVLNGIYLIISFIAYFRIRKILGKLKALQRKDSQLLRSYKIREKVKDNYNQIEMKELARPMIRQIPLPTTLPTLPRAYSDVAIRHRHRDTRQDPTPQPLYLGESLLSLD
jgi:hypothetical protein